MRLPVFSFRTRPTLISRLQSETFDALIIGGGITGAAVARDAACRGMKVALVEAGDFASGTSSGSSKLLHGGVRYLEQFEFKLVYEAIQEREKLKSIYAPLVQDLPFVFPTFSHLYPQRWKLNLGLYLYDAFSKFRSPHVNLSKKQTLGLYPWLKDNQLSGACRYIDSFGEDFRVVIEIVKSAVRKNAVCLSRVEVKAFGRENSLHTLKLKDLISGHELFTKAKYIFNCAGPYSDEVRKLLGLPSKLRLTQGVHFCIPRERLPIETAFVLPDPKLHRILFAIPWKKTTYLGTTDTPIDDPRQARATKYDLEYVLRIANQFFNVNLTRSDVFQSWAAVRPLIKPTEDEKNPSAISREHQLEESPQNIFHLLGGKLTSHRIMAKEALDRVSTPVDSFETEILITGEQYPANQNLDTQVQYSTEHEMALTPLDFIRRRTSLYYEEPSIKIAEEVSSHFAKICQWTEEQKSKNLNEVLESYKWDKEGY